MNFFLTIIFSFLMPGVVILITSKVFCVMKDNIDVGADRCFIL